MLLAKFPPGDAGLSEIERVTVGLRETMGWVADAIERTALNEAPRAVATDEGRKTHPAGR